MDHFVGILNHLQAAKRKAATYEKSKIQNFSDQQINEEIMDFKLKQQQQQQNNLEEIKERQQTLSSLEKDIGDINQILTDLSQMVYNQNEVVETIEKLQLLKCSKEIYK
uniref:t-SNARE coiled-coil homology domain-containing protein n=1 Tax=Meloidogyne incognita TaxID=6306 RepID=A0A914N3S6_MELIC